MMETETLPPVTEELKTRADRLYDLIRPYHTFQGRHHAITLPDGECYLLYTAKGTTNRETCHAVIDLYERLYPSEQPPLMRHYDQACSRIRRNIQPPPDEEEEEEEEQEKPTRGKAKRENPYAAFIQQLLSVADWTHPGKKIGTRYARIPYIGKEFTAAIGDNTGLWFIDPFAPPVRLLDAAIYCTELNRPHGSSKSNNYWGVLKAVNSKGEPRGPIAFTRDDIEGAGGIDGKFTGYAVWPSVPTEKYRLIEIFKAITTDKAIRPRDHMPSFGWKIPDRLVWLDNNGIETEHGFIPSEQSSFVAPTMLSPGNGYKGLTKVPPLSSLNDDLWELLLNELNPSNCIRMYGKLGAVMRLIFPEGTVEGAGKLDFCIETIGDGTGQGKSTEDTLILSEFGTDFPFKRPPLLSTTSSGPSRPRLMEMMEYLPFSTEDRKAKEGSPEFLKQHATRRALIEMYADNTGGGLIMTAYGKEMVSRGNPQGLPLLTGNADHSAYAFRQESGDEEMIEHRVCTFILAPDEKANHDVSVAIGERRHELTAWGTYVRRWIMREYNRDKNAFMLRIQSLRVPAEEKVRAVCENWPHWRPMAVCIDIVWGMLARQAFLEDMFPDSYQERFLWQWIETFTTAFIEDRLERTRFLASQKQKHAEELDVFLLNTLRYLLKTHQYHIASQQGKFLTSGEVPYPLADFGMQPGEDYEGHELWRPSQHGAIGYYLPRKTAIALDFSVLYPVMKLHASLNKYPLPPQVDFKETLAKTGTSHMTKDKHGDVTRFDTAEWVCGKAGWYITIDLDTLYPVVQGAGPEEEELPCATENITFIKRPQPPVVQPNGTDEYF